MGQIVDFVPNHMGIGERNEWWMDVLENGPSSVYAPYFDIDWHPLKEQLENKVLLPILGDQYGRVLEHGEFKIEFEKGSFFAKYYTHRLPIAPRTYSILLQAALEFLEKKTPGEPAAPADSLPDPALVELQKHPHGHRASARAHRGSSRERSPSAHAKRRSSSSASNASAASTRRSPRPSPRP